MFHFNGLPDVDSKSREILEEHLNRMLTMTTAFAAGLLGKVPEKQLPWEKKDLPAIRGMVCPPHIKKDRDRLKLILGALEKLHDSSYAELSAGEKYFFMRVSAAAFKNEADVICRLVDENSKERLSSWMINNYRIYDDARRKKVLKAVKKVKEPRCAAGVYLDDLGEKYKNAVMDIVGHKKMLEYEFPTAIYMLLSANEMQLLAGLQPEASSKAG